MATILTNSSKINSGRFGVLKFIAQVIQGRWFMLCASFFILAGAGGVYVFGSYSEAIKRSQGYDQSTLNFLGFCKDLGGNLGAPIGFIGEVTPPWLVLLIGSVLNFGGYFMIWLVVTGRISKPHVWQVGLVCFDMSCIQPSKYGSDLVFPAIVELGWTSSPS